MAQYVNSVLKELAGKLGLADLSLDERDRVSLTFEDTEVILAHTPEPLQLLWIYIDLGPIPETGDEAPAFLLRSGVATWALGHMTIGLDQSGRRAQGHTSIPVTLLDLPLLHKSLTTVLELAGPLRERLARSEYGTPSPGENRSLDRRDQLPPGLDPNLLRV